ncbi:MAG: hypothetical protein RLY93_10155 [Sumerlaeia bacterium]
MTEVSIRPDLILVPRTDTPMDRSIEKKRIRKHSVLRVIRDFGPLSRADIAKLIGYNLPSVTFLVDELVDAGLVIQGEAKKTARGRRPIPCTLNARAAMVLGIDVGPEKVTCIYADLNGEVLVRESHPRPSGSGEGFGNAICEIAQKAASSYKGEEEIPPLSGIGLGISGESGNAVRVALGRSFGVPVLHETRARVMALGSLWFGAAKSYQTFIYADTDGEAEAVLVINKRIYKGVSGGAGTLDGAANPKELAKSIAQLIPLFDPEAIIFSASKNENLDESIKELHGQLKKLKLQDSIEVATCDLGPESGPVGSMATVLNHIFSTAHIDVEQIL